MTLCDVAKYQIEWVKMAIHCGSSNGLALDFVQNMYLKLADIQEKEGDLSRITYRGDINKSYVFSIIRSEVVNHYRKESSYKHIPVEECYIAADFDKRIDNEELLRSVKTALKDINWFSRMVFEIYVNDNHSIRSLAEATQINRGTIQHEIKYVKEKIKSHTRKAC